MTGKLLGSREGSFGQPAPEMFVAPEPVEMHPHLADRTRQQTIDVMLDDLGDAAARVRNDRQARGKRL